MIAAVLIIAAGVGGASTSLGSVMYVGIYLGEIFDQLLAFLLPATIVVALREINFIAKG